MTSNANFGADSPYPSRPASAPGAGSSSGFSHPALDYDDRPHEHHPDAENLLRRYLSEIHSYRQLGNVALRELEDRLAALAGTPEAGAPAQARPTAHSVLMRPSLPETEPEETAAAPSLNQRLRELSAYLHADLTRQEITQATAPQQHDEPPRRAERRPEPQPRPAPRAEAPAEPPHAPRYVTSHAHPHSQPHPHKVTPNAPVLDRAWFEERFATMRASIDQIAENIPVQRIEALEAQFSLLMEKLDEGKTDRSVSAVEAGLKKLAAYLEDNRQWTSKHDVRVRGVEERLDQLSGLVAQSHAAISATAKGLEIVARGTGPELARATADLVAQRLQPQLDARSPGPELARATADLVAQRLQPQIDAARGAGPEIARATADLVTQRLQPQIDAARGSGHEVARTAADLVTERLQPQLTALASQEPITQLGHQLSSEIAKLSAQSTQVARGLDERLKQLQNEFDDSLDRLTEVDPHRAAPQEDWQSRLGAEDYEDDYDDKPTSAAQRAARLGAAAASQSLPQNGEPVRYQIPYGEFLPEEENSHSRTGLIIVAVILLLASAAMLYLNLRDRGGSGALSGAALSHPTSTPKEAAIQPVAPLTTASTGAKISERITQAAPVSSRASSQLWVTSVTGDEDAISGPQSVPGVNAASDADPLQLPLVNGVKKGDSLRQAAVDGNVDAQFSVGETYLDGSDNDSQLPVGERLSKAARWFRRAAEHGHVPSQYRLATLYELGQGAPKSYADAVSWYEKAAKNGHVKAMHNLAVLSVNGDVRSANYVTAAKWFTEAAEHGLRDSQYNLGVLYERGLGVPKDPATAYVWFSLAANQGDVKGARKRDDLAARLSSVDRMAADARVAAWTPAKIDALANGDAPEPPAEQSLPAEPVILPKSQAPQLLQSAWGAQITPINSSIAEAQRLLAKLGYKPGPADGIPGPKTTAAIRAFEKRLGWPMTGAVSKALLAKMSVAL